MTGTGEPGALVPLDGTLNVRDLGGWPTADGRSTAWGRLYRSDRLSDLSPADHAILDDRSIDTVVDLRYEAEAAEHPSKLWSAVEQHRLIPMGGEMADQRSFIQRALDGDFDGITDDDVGESYIEMLERHGPDFGQAVEVLLAGRVGLYHCTAGKDRTGLLTMLILATIGVDADNILADFVLSNEYRAERRMAQLAAVFAAEGLDIERYRPALSAPRPAMVRAMDWIEANHRSPEDYLAGPGAVADVGDRLRSRLLEPGR